MPHRPTRGGSKPEAPPATADADLMRHLRALGLESVEAYRRWCRENGFRTATRKSWQEQRQERQAVRKRSAETVSRSELLRHVEALGLATVDDYQDWCRRHGFSDALQKRPQQRQQERLAAGRRKAEATLAETRRHSRRPEETIRRIYQGEIDPGELGSPPLQRIAACFGAIEGRSAEREAFLRLLLHAGKHARLLDTEPAVHYLGYQQGNSRIEALLALARRHEEWLRPVEEWRPESRSPHRQFGSLTRHLLAKYAVPAFMDAAWFEGDTTAARRHQAWFRHIGAGQNIRTADLPLHLTKRMAHEFLQAPDDLTIDGALRYGQVLGLGGDEPLARAVLSTRLGETDEHESFWVTVLKFFVNNPMLDTAWVGPIIDYVYHQKFVPREAGDLPGAPAENGPVEAPAPPWPDFSMKGRTVTPLLRLVEQWHAELAREARKRPEQWERSGLQGFEAFTGARETGDLACWAIREVVTSKELTEEGRAMSHCVASYARSCARGHTSVWSMQFQDCRMGSCRRVMTIAVNNARRTITQARGRCNRLPGAKGASERLNYAPEILRQWAKQEGLLVLKHL